jgi:hypothetical protein
LSNTTLRDFAQRIDTRFGRTARRVFVVEPERDATSKSVSAGPKFSLSTEATRDRKPLARLTFIFEPALTR